MEYPMLVYKDVGPYQRPGGTFSTKQVVDEDGYLAALSDGWYPTLPAAIAKEPTDDMPPSRAELEAKATELGIEFDGRTTDKKLVERINEKLTPVEE